jgi:DNA-binding beta-propeller fold protein YncE
MYATRSKQMAVRMHRWSAMTNEEKKMRKFWTAVALAIVGLILGGCGGGHSDSNVSGIKALISIPNITPSTNFSFDISGVDSASGRMYFTDRNNKSVDVIDIKTNTVLKQIFGGFAGCNTGPSCAGASNDMSGPDGLNIIPGTTLIYVGDVNSVKIIDTQSDTVVKTIAIGGTSGLRADEGCYDPDDKIYMINSPGESPPFATFIDTTSQKIIATLLFTDPGTGPGGPGSLGLEACVYDHASGSFLNNNDGSTANPNGEVDVIPASFIKAGTPAAPVTLTLPVPTLANGFKIFPLGNCDPTGLDLGPGTDMAVSCRQGTAGVPLTVQILDRTNGLVRATLNAGGGDQITYDSASNRYYLAASRWTSSGKSSGPACTAASLCTPVLVTIDAALRTVVSMRPTGNNAHSVAVDPATHQVYMPYSGATAPAGCNAETCNLVPNGGVMVLDE